MLEAALWWPRRHVGVFPCWGVADGRCLCPLGVECKHPGKHPIELLAPRGFLSASRDPRRIGQWFGDATTANIAGAIPQGIAILDVDGPEGWASLDRWQAAHGRLPVTFTCSSGRGAHLWFRIPRTVVQRSPLPKVDTRVGGKGYVILPPSAHYSGRRYAVTDRSPVADAPAALMLLLDPPPPERRPAPTPAWDQPSAVDEAQRRLLGMLRAACRRIEAAGRGARHQTVSREAYNIGGYLDGCGATVDQVAPSLVSAAETCGCDDPHRTVITALEAGRRMPRPLPPNSSTYRGTHAHQ